MQEPYRVKRLPLSEYPWSVFRGRAFVAGFQTYQEAEAYARTQAEAETWKEPNAGEATSTGP